MVELLGQVVQALQTSQLGDEPLLVALLGLLETLPGGGDVGDHFALIFIWIR